jgi:23S rRNA maturation-related 3'-5' exoribonuclease YhaM
MENIKGLMTRYNKAQQASQDAAALRKELVHLLKEEGLTKAKFDFGERSVSYHSYNKHEDITQKLIKRMIVDRYPQVNADNFMKDLNAIRTKKLVETLQVEQRKKDRNSVSTDPL